MFILKTVLLYEVVYKGFHYSSLYKCKWNNYTLNCRKIIYGQYEVFSRQWKQAHLVTHWNKILGNQWLLTSDTFFESFFLQRIPKCNLVFIDHVIAKNFGLKILGKLFAYMKVAFKVSLIQNFFLRCTNLLVSCTRIISISGWFKLCRLN